MKELIKVYATMPLDEKRFVLNELFTSHENMAKKNYNEAGLSLIRVNSLLGENEQMLSIQGAINKMNLGYAQSELGITIKALIKKTAPSNEEIKSVGGK